MGKKTEKVRPGEKKTGKKERHKKTKEGKKEQAKRSLQEQTLDRFIAATLEELILAVNELPDGIILEVYL